MDDRQVRDICQDTVVTSAAYLLLYQRRRGPLGPSARSLVQLNYSDPEEIDWDRKKGKKKNKKN